MPYRVRDRTRSNAKRTLVRATTRRGLSIVQVGTITKPPYAIPSIAAIRATPKHGHTVVSLFAGCGGSCLGFEWAGFHVCYANEFVPEAQDVYRRNHPDVPLDVRDIRTVTADEILQRAGIAPGEVDVLQGSPPCASFSMSGNRTKFWGKEKSYCVDPTTPVLKTDMTWQPAGELIAGDMVVAFDENPDNDSSGMHRYFKPAAVENVARLTRPCVRITMSDDTVVVCSVEHRWLVQQGRNLRWRVSSKIKPGDSLRSIGQPWKTDKSYDGGYLAGLFDGEGCVSQHSVGKVRVLQVSQKPGVVLDTGVALLRKIGADIGIYQNTEGVCHVNVNGGPFGKARVLGIVRPQRLLPQAEKLWRDVSIKATKQVTVRSIEDVGEREVVALETSERTFIANGLLSHNSGTSQRTDDLFFEYVRLLEGLQPKVFIAENVAGLVRGQAKGMFKEILTALAAVGYHVEARILDAQWLGVPQIRARLIFQGVRRDITKTPVWPTPLPYQYSVRDALPHVYALRGGQGMPFTGKNATYDPDHPSATILAHANLFVATVDNRLDPFAPPSVEDPFAAGPEPGADMSSYAIGEEWKLLREGEVSRRYQNLIRAKADAPAPTITAAGGEPSAAAPAHPYECRKFSIAELRRLCGFPDDFVLTGTYTQQWERLGRAVPPPMMRAVARGIATEIFDAGVDTG